MSNAFTNFLGGVVSGVFSSNADMKDYQHADRLYVRNNFVRSPKHGFLYYIVFNINPAAVRVATWTNRKRKDVGILVKRIDIPKFTVNTETLNQYNRKTIIQTSMKYNPISVEFHDDNDNITSGLWENYYKYYYVDSNYGSTNTKNTPPSFKDTKYGTTDWAYGLNGNQVDPFFESVDIYVLHQKKFTQYTLINPIITEWAYDTLNQDEGGKVLASRMNLAYENVIFKTGEIKKGGKPDGFTVAYYDTAPSPLSVGGNGTATLFGAGGVIAGAGGLFGTLANASSPLDYINAAIQAKNLSKNVRELSKAGLKQEGYSILKGVLGNITTNNNQPNSVGSTPTNNGNFGGLGNIGVNIFNNSSGSNTTKATPRTDLGGGP